ncbi:aspartate aminotransferase family protein [Candidatus Methylomirabilis sp.]|uniref:glutamate-1-semialdehyde 2,1-aminomutase n=1 Tax=Candidatus Methylomirabilis tolerans TaxID=3123416 RepID=A0AAJ1EJK7_9BACT|nr:aspartate aminotransferase family protein [Candidatus Methylomirabilis sp.]
MKKSGVSIYEQFRRMHPRSEALFRRAQMTIAGGLTHDIRHLHPFPIYVDRAHGSRKWDVDDHELIDYWMGHGALILGHGHPTVQQAIVDQLGRGTHYGACHELEIQWAEQVLKLIPGIDRVRFVGSGTEATLLAIRIARAVTGRDKIVKFEGHFHGWHDYAAAAIRPPFDRPMSAGVPQGVLHDILICPPNDWDAFMMLTAHRNDIAGVILEPAGGSCGTIPTDLGFLKRLRDFTRAQDIALIFDEVISGFRLAPGGAQQQYGIYADLTTLAKILAGGMPGGAVAGRAPLMDQLAFRDDQTWNREERVWHAGTFNANPLSAAAGTATLPLLADGQVQSRADRAGQALRDGINEVIAQLGADACAYGESSIVNLFLQPRRHALLLDRPDSTVDHCLLMEHPNQEAYHQMRCALILNGVDFPLFHGWVSAAHSDEDMEKTIRAFEAALRLMQDEGAL